MATIQKLYLRKKKFHEQFDDNLKKNLFVSIFEQP